MLKSFFLWGFVVVPLAIAIALIAYRARFVLVAIVALLLVMASIWTALRFEDSIAEWWNGAPPGTMNCADVPPGSHVPPECAL
jgi:hypothetical protein